ncbi:MAG TPA: prepilin peptidase [Stellaceae bacterium]|nr:prepilin peptidase [Stellaceae bacterium]
MLTALALVLLVVCLLGAAASDAAKYRIPNTLCLGVVAAFLIYAAGAALSFSVLGAHLAAGVAVLVVAAAGFALRLMGGGDAKLLAAVALWLGWKGLPPFLLLMAVIGGVLALMLLAARRLAPKPIPTGRWWSALLLRRGDVPYGVAISAATLILLARFPGELLP